MSDTQQSTAPVETSTGDASETTEDGALGTYEQRVQSAYDEIREEESAKGSDVTESPTPAGAPEKGATDAASKAREERNARLEKLKQQEAAAHEEQSRRAAPDKAARAEMDELEQLRAQAARAHELEKAFSSPEEFLKAARGRIREDDLVDWIRQGIEDPARDAVTRATAALSPEMQAMKQRLDAQDAALAELRREKQQAAAERTESQAQETILSFLDSGKDAMPLAASFLAKHGRDEFMKLAYAAAEHVPPGSGEQALLDVVESSLEQFVGIAPTPATATAPSRATPPAAAKAKTLSNSLASARASVVEDEDDFVEDYDERVRRAAESLFG